MQKLNIKKINHFFVNYKPYSNLLYKDKSNKVVLICKNEFRLAILSYIKKILQNNLETKVFSISYNKKLNKNFLFVRIDSTDYKKIYDKLLRLLKITLSAKFGINISFAIADYYQLYKGIQSWDEENLKNLARNCVENKSAINTKPMTKTLREKAYKVLVNYQRISWKSININAGKIIKIYYRVVK
ncbi:hypothetical protein SHELI_v1c11560 [Spiroplasma helicoides]|uniref:Uncharacterized protein n=1 Tax=Spiroplasma helicoides TaxID=216938 RepID=A0A1B3SMD8_9MOLU|nr:hypothetical protein [Spiroplasma helicoides]AOG61103.1 hypothetical protein SHELI_v1c11560 [Spiroplasma helicoides]